MPARHRVLHVSEETREQLAALVSNTARTVAQLADATGLSPTAIRSGLASLPRTHQLREGRTVFYYQLPAAAKLAAGTVSEPAKRAAPAKAVKKSPAKKSAAVKAVKKSPAKKSAAVKAVKKSPAPAAKKATAAKKALAAKKELAAQKASVRKPAPAQRASSAARKTPAKKTARRR